MEDDNLDEDIVELLWRIEHLKNVDAVTEREAQTQQRAKNCLLHVSKQEGWDNDGVCASVKVYNGFTQIVHFPLSSLDEKDLQTSNSLTKDRRSVFPIAWSVTAGLMKVPFLSLWDESRRGEQSNWIPSNPKYPILLPNTLPVKVGETKITFDSKYSHLKLGVHPDGVVCIGDSNLEGGQVGRSGLTICFQDVALARAFSFGADLVLTTQPAIKLTKIRAEIVIKQDNIRVSSPGLAQMLNTYVQQPVGNNNNHIQIDADGYLPMETSSGSYDSDAPLFSSMETSSESYDSDAPLFSSSSSSQTSRSTHFDSDADLFLDNSMDGL
jgi:hypothetical protein